MANLDTSVFVYDDPTEAEGDWQALESAAQAGSLTMADAALVVNRNGEAVIVQRQSHHGWGKGAVVGAVVGILFPPSILGAAAVGAGAGGLLSGMTRALGRDKVKNLGDALDSGATAIIVVSPAQSTNGVCNTLVHARTITTVPSSTEDDIRQAMS
jgi:uncharacterized membrane protein